MSAKSNVEEYIKNTVHELYYKSDDEVIRSCYQYGEAFEKRFGSLRCMELRPGGFSENDPPHMCEMLICEAILFTYNLIEKTQ